MNRRTLVLFLKAVVLIVAVFSLLLLGYVIPTEIFALAESNSEYVGLTAPAIVTDSVCLIFIFVALCYLWQLCTDIARDRSFTATNSKRLLKIGMCAVVDTVASLVMFVILLIKNTLHPGICVIGLGVITFGIFIATIAFLLSYLVSKAEKLEDDAKYTV